MADKTFGINTGTFNAAILLILLIILGIVSFHFYTYISANNGLAFGTGFGVNLLPQYYQQQQQQQQQPPQKGGMMSMDKYQQ